MTNYETILAACKDEVAKAKGYFNWEYVPVELEDKFIDQSALLAMQRVAEGERSKGYADGWDCAIKEHGLD